MIPKKLMLQVWLLFFAGSHKIGTVHCQMGQPQLTSSVPDKSGVYPGQLLVFRCTIEGSILSWRSNECFNNGLHEMAFTLGQEPGQMQEFESAVAILDNVTDGSTIHSTLRIPVSKVHQTFTVSCFNKDSGLKSNRTFYLNNKPAVEITAENNVTCSNDDVRFDCEVRSSSTLLLSGIEHVIFGGETLICSRSNSSNYTILIHDKMVTVLQTYSSDSNGTSLLKCSIIMNTNGLPIDMWLSINCQNVNIGISRNNSFMVSQDPSCLVTTASQMLITTEITVVSKASVAVGVYCTGIPLLGIVIPLLLCVSWISS